MRKTRKIFPKPVFVAIIGVGLLVAVSVFPPVRGDEQWLIGRWQLVYDPDEVKTDWLEFHSNGDVFNIWHDGTHVPGIYIVGDDSVKAVFTYQNKDLIATFHYDEAKTELRIVTSDTGKESIYKKDKAGN